MDEHADGPRVRPVVLPEGYKKGATEETLLSWLHVQGRLEGAENYWLITAAPTGRPHATPVWGVWVDNSLIMDGSPITRWGRNIAANRQVTIHLESGTDVVIVDGTVEDVVIERDLAERIVSDWNRKYGRLVPDPAGSGVFRFHPRSARAWTDFPTDATTFRWD